MKTSIVILTYNQLDYTKLCIESIRAYTEPGTYELIIVDNASSDGTQEWIKQQKDITAIYNDQNLGFPKGCNQGMKISNGDNILLLNNDVVVTNNWLNQLTTALYSDNSIGAVSCVTNRCSYNQMIPTHYNNLDEMQQFAKSFNSSNSKKWIERLKLVGFCFLIKNEIIHEIGYFDEIFTPGNHEDDDYSIRIRQSGYKLLLCQDTFIHHFGSVSFNEEKQDYVKLLNKNEKKFTDKWGFDSIYAQHIRNEVVDLIQEQPETKLNVLEVGCACGGTLLEIKNRYKNSHLFGIELNPASAKIASIIAEMHNTNIEKDPLDIPENFFDYVILADVLEHMYDPWAALKNIRKHLKPEGKLLISLPNVMHHSVLKQLINGSWTYEEAGILDKTHLRFFTLQEIEKLISVTGYEINTLSGTTLPSTKDNEMFIEKLAMLTQEPGIKRQFNVYQYIFSSSKSKLFDTLGTLLDFKEQPNLVVELLQTYSHREVIKNILNIPDEARQVELLNMIGVTHFEAGKYDRVLPYFEAAHILDVNNNEVLYNIAYFLNFIGEKETAKKYGESLQKVDTQSYLELTEVIASFK